MLFLWKITVVMEISSMLDISITTVIFHRNNICSKLGTRSIGKMTIFAVLAGLVEINEI
jgi:DNA-binding CsgD family transcriptional regulator